MELFFQNLFSLQNSHEFVCFSLCTQLFLFFRKDVRYIFIFRIELFSFELFPRKRDVRIFFSREKEIRREEKET